jgi:hypothetical protein
MYLFDEMNNPPSNQMRGKDKLRPTSESLDSQKAAKLNDIIKGIKLNKEDFDNITTDNPEVYHNREKELYNHTEPHIANQSPQQNNKVDDSNSKKILKIVIFYTDHTFEEFKPNL